MDDTGAEIRVTLAEHSVRIDNAEKQIENLSHIATSIQDLTISVNELALSIKHMLAEQQSHGERIHALEEVPAKNWSTMTRTIFTSILSTVAGAIAVGLIWLASGKF